MDRAERHHADFLLFIFHPHFIGLFSGLHQLRLVFKFLRHPVIQGIQVGGMAVIVKILVPGSTPFL